MMAAELRMVLYEDDSVQVQYVDGSRLQLSPCGAEFLFEKAPPASAHPLEQPERIRQRTHFVISTYREQLQRALDFRNSFATYPFLSENLMPCERKKRVPEDIAEVRWPSLGSEDGVLRLQGGTGKGAPADGLARLRPPPPWPELAAGGVGQKLGCTAGRAEKDQDVEKAGGTRSCGGLSAERLPCPALRPEEPSGQARPPGGCVLEWEERRWAVAACPAQSERRSSLPPGFREGPRCAPGTDAAVARSSASASASASAVRGAGGAAASLPPRTPRLGCRAPHLHRWTFSNSLPLGQSEEEDYSYPELVKVVWHKGVMYRLTHKNVNSIEIYPGDGSVFKSEGAYFGNFFTYCSFGEGSEEREEKMYSVKNLPPDRPGSLFSVCSLIQQAARILQHCAKMRLSLSHNYRICCWKMVPGRNDNTLPVLLKELFIPSVGRLLAYSDDKVHVIFLDGVTLTLNWNFDSFIENRQASQGLSLGWCKLTFPDGHDQLIQVEHSGPYERYVSTVISWCRRLTQTSQREMLTLPSFSIPEENWCVASELKKIQKFNSLLENSGVLTQISTKKNEQSSEYIPKHSETLIEEGNEKRVSVELKKISEVIQDIDCLLSNSKK